MGCEFGVIAEKIDFLCVIHTNNFQIYIIHCVTCDA